MDHAAARSRTPDDDGAPPEVPLDFAREWIDLPDPADAGHVVRADLTWLASAWTCIFGRGCAGVVEGRPDDGCCSHGAYFSDGEDLARVTAAVAGLRAEDWQLAATAREAAGAGDPVTGWTEQDAGTDADAAEDDPDADVSGAAVPATSLRTRVVDGACIFLNRPGHPGGSGCALHRMAVRTGVHPLTTKPDVCWQLPLRREEEDVERPDGTQLRRTTLGEFDRRGWGAGGHDLHWWCSGSPVAHVAPEPLVETYAHELTALVGPAAYAELRRLVQARLDQGLLAPHPASPRPVPVELRRRRPGS